MRIGGGGAAVMGCLLLWSVGIYCVSGMLISVALAVDRIGGYWGEGRPPDMEWRGGLPECVYIIPGAGAEGIVHSCFVLVEYEGLYA